MERLKTQDLIPGKYYSKFNDLALCTASAACRAPSFSRIAFLYDSTVFMGRVRRAEISLVEQPSLIKRRTRSSLVDNTSDDDLQIERFIVFVYRLH